MKKVLALALSLALIATLAISGTVAYLQDTDEDVNVMTLGNVKIEQHEYERAKNDDGTLKIDKIDDQDSYVLQDFTQDKPLLPIVGDPSKPGNDPEYAGWDNTTVRMSQKESYGGMQVFAGLNAQDKFVTVENTGKSDAYVRTIVAIEAGSTNGSLVGSSYHGNWAKNEIGLVKIDGYQYHVVEYVYKGAEGVRHENGILPADDTTYPNLSQVYLKSDATNEDMEALDGNGNGKLDILVLSQAVQAQGFYATEEKSAALNALDTAFGETAENAAEWFGDASPVSVSNDAELAKAIASGATNIYLKEGNYGVIDVAQAKRTLTIAAASGADVTIAGIDGQSNDTSTDLTVKNVTIDNSEQTEGWYTGTAKNIKPCVGVWGGDYTFENCTFYVTGESGAETGVMTWWTTNHGVLNFKNCTFNGGNGSARGMQIYGNYDLNVTGCTFNTEKDYSIKYVGAEGCKAVLQGNKVNKTTNFVQLGSAPYAGNNYSIEFVGNTLAAGINHIYVDNAEGQTITIDGEVKEATTGAIY